ncbi:hypothetical protein KGM_206661 [Danaus plexippus plexippus]|uniref:Uncharacterized protein n=1 Tax=Danaus plexippus plexippus TaxID=278856 RepID=A0A212FC85_DANPL|nr:hypothetical protein KGM_206661 [Danaus plexippus plexippus]
MRRLANFEASDEYECYTESYIKCFWGLCDHQKSMHALITKSNSEVITKAPVRQHPTYKNPGLIGGFIYNSA